MKGNMTVIDCLNRLLENELASVDQYLTHSRMYEDWGLDKLYQHINHEMEEEIGHADLLIKRILFLEGTPDLSRRGPLTIGFDVETMLKNDLALEYKVMDGLRAGIALCEQHNDYVSREMLEKLLDDTEQDHIYWLEQQMGLIGKIGLQNYIQSQMS